MAGSGQYNSVRRGIARRFDFMEERVAEFKIERIGFTVGKGDDDDVIDRVGVDHDFYDILFFYKLTLSEVEGSLHHRNFNAFDFCDLDGFVITRVGVANHAHAGIGGEYAF